MVPETVSILSSIPAIAWSGFIAATAALAGVILSNSGNNRRLRLQLKHDAGEKNLDRITNMRREVYLQAAEAMTKASSALGSLPNKDLINTDICLDFQPLFCSCAKIQLIADSDTALKVGLLAEHYGTLFMRLTARLAPLQSARLEIKMQTEQCEEARSQSKRLTRELSQFQEAARSDADIFNALFESRAGHDHNAVYYSDKVVVAWGEFNKSLALFNQELMVEMVELSKAQIPVLVAMRKDLGMSTDIEKYARQLDDSNRKVELAMQEAFKGLA